MCTGFVSLTIWFVSRLEFKERFWRPKRLAEQLQVSQEEICSLDLIVLLLLVLEVVLVVVVVIITSFFSVVDFNCSE